ncbi:hypothetical protein CEXT_407671 [Caerostris extrusa]|uniref:Uncharacterized protein n=1 Tax=Caerostris extrusa TaxID=172846 RepID=A0AAV4MS48_CAEEX|nr:hypothetical protein CEXT_407671 [Caerostris extrusa]
MGWNIFLLKITTRVEQKNRQFRISLMFCKDISGNQKASLLLDVVIKSGMQYKCQTNPAGIQFTTQLVTENFLLSVSLVQQPLDWRALLLVAQLLRSRLDSKSLVQLITKTNFCAMQSVTRWYVPTSRSHFHPNTMQSTDLIKSQARF